MELHQNKGLAPRQSGWTDGVTVVSLCAPIKGSRSAGIRARGDAQGSSSKGRGLPECPRVEGCLYCWSAQG
eukprot:4682002-Pyramimonas_sp.AAC.1